MKKQLRGVLLVERAIAALAIRSPRPVPEHALDGATLGGHPLPPSLRRWLAHHALLPRPVRTRLWPEGLGLSSWRDVAPRALGRQVLPPDPPPPLAACGLLPLDVGDSSFRVLVAGVPDAAGELPVLDVDADDPSVTLAMPGFDVWLAVMAGLVDPKKVRAHHEAALREHAQASLGGAMAWLRTKSWEADPDAAWQPPPYPKPRKGPRDPRTELVDTVRDGDLEGVRELLDAGVSPSEPDSLGRLALTHAASLAHTEIVELLLARGAPVDAVDDTQTTAFAFVAGMNWWWYAKAAPPLLERWLRCLRILAAHGADPNFRDGYSLAAAARERSLPLVSMVLELGADPRAPTVLEALLRKPMGRRTQKAHDVVACLALLLERGAAVDGPRLLALAREDPGMPAEVYRLLRERGVDGA